MKARTLGGLAAAVLVLGLIAWVMDSADSKWRTAQRFGGPLLAGFAADQVERVRITTPDSTSDLERTESGWKDRPSGAAGDRLAIEGALKELSQIDRADLQSHKPARHPDLGVDADNPGGITVELWLEPSEAPSRTVRIGKSGPDHASTFVRLGQEDRVYLAATDLRAVFDRGSIGWRDRSIFSFAPEQAVRLVLEDGDRSLTAERVEGAEVAVWRVVEPAGSSVSSAAIAAAVANLAALYGDGFADEAARKGLETSHSRARIELSGDRQLELRIGREYEGQHPAQRVGDETVFTLYGYRKDAIFGLLGGSDG